eukprot:TRINITY_DN7075_c0_g1_i1.p1 TRINITY_DN7075_c0_g1~~TRINITY_DN7075_c0_g1_i1.p1  ORF type:complete len:908 (+),score=259.80 TRINITY_DN7075_c0_g1_i1:34-2757(+)
MLKDEVERKRSVPKKSQQHRPVGQTQGMSLLPYSRMSNLKASWSSGDFGSPCSLQGSIVLKFGGSSVGNKLKQVLALIERHAREGAVAVVVSAMGKTTDHLIDAADKACLSCIEESHEKVALIEEIAVANIDKHCTDVGAKCSIIDKVRALLQDLRQLLLGISLVRELSPATLDRLLSFGERLSALVVASLLTVNGTPAHPVDGKDWVVTDDEHGKARVEWAETQEKLTKALQAWPEASVPIVTGFLGCTVDGRRTTLGRNGSDYTASLLGLGIGACKVIINTDVPGVFTADPGIVKEAYPVSELSYVEAMELSIYGSRMFHPRTILPLVDQRIPMVIRNTDDPDGPATVIMDAVSADRSAVHGAQATCVTQLENMAVLSLRSRLGQPGSIPVQHIGLRLTSCLGTANVKIHHASFAANGQAVHVVMSQDQAEEAKEALLREFEREVRLHELDEMNLWQPVSLLSLVRAPQTVVPKFFAALTAARVKVRSIGQGSDSSSVSCVIDSHDTAVAVRCAHTAINLGHQIVSLLVLGNNSSSRGLLQRIKSKYESLLAKYKVELRVVAVYHTCGQDHSADQTEKDTTELHEEGLDLNGKLKEMGSCTCNDDSLPRGKRMSSIVPVRVLQRLRQMSCPMVVDCNRLDIEVSDFYRTCQQLGVNVVVSNASSIVRLGRNKLPCSMDGELITYDTSVGASVPICDTIRMLNQMGDEVVRIEGSLSGTCGFIAVGLTNGGKLSEVVGDAIAKQYAEPHVASDLSGLDTARKLVALARHMGKVLRLEDIERKPLVSEEILQELQEADGESIVSVLQKHDAVFDNGMDTVRHDGKKLAYIAEMDFSNDTVKASLGPRFVTVDHPAYQLKDTEIYAQIERDGFRSEHPLILQGPGCGSSSAVGIVGDILKTALKLQGL